MRRSGCAHLDEAARLAQPAAESRSLRTDKAHRRAHILLNTLSIFTQYPEQMQRYEASIKARSTGEDRPIAPPRRAHLRMVVQSLPSHKTRLQFRDVDHGAPGVFVSVQSPARTASRDPDAFPV
jgi:hypothetical protein